MVPVLRALHRGGHARDRVEGAHAPLAALQAPGRGARLGAAGTSVGAASDGPGPAAPTGCSAAGSIHTGGA